MKKQRIPLVVETAFGSLRNEVKIFFSIALVSVLLIELVFKNWPAANHTFYAMGDIYLKLCYSLTASIIFLFVNVQYPKELKKIKLHPLITNTTAHIKVYISILMSTLFHHNDLKELPEVEKFREVMEKINPHSKPTFHKDAIKLQPEFANYFALYHFLLEDIQKNAHFLLTFHDSIDTDLMTILRDVYSTIDIINKTITIPGMWAIGTPSMFQNLQRSSKALDKILVKKYPYTSMQGNLLARKAM
jgi:hypothetical protein